MVIHIKKVTIEEAAQLICETVQKPQFKTTPESKKILNDSLLSATVHAAIVQIIPKIIITADDGVVSIGNKEAPLDVKDSVSNEIRSIAEKVEGGKKIILS